MTHLNDAGLADAKDFLYRRLPWDLSRPRFIDSQRNQIETDTLADPLFPAHLRQIALSALDSDDRAVVRRALTCLAIVGAAEDIQAVKPLLEDQDADVRKDARTSIFEIERGV
jgi:HEAT repeat protein